MNASTRVIARTAVAVLAIVAASLASRSDASAQGAGGVGGRVLEAGAGVPIAGAVVEISGPVERSVVSDGEGRWRASGLPAGSYRIRATHLAYGDRSLDVEVASGGSDIEVRMTPRALPLDAVVVTAGRRLQRLAEVVVATELITRRDIERSGSADLSQILVERLGVQLEGGHPSGEGVMLQGMTSQRVLILLDGQPLVGRISGNLDLSRIPASAVERVEVVKGPQSSLYGSEAMGGVVNVITRDAVAGQWRGGMAVAAGTQGRADISGTLAGGTDRLSFSSDIGRRVTELTPGRADDHSALSERWDALLKATAGVTPSVDLEANVLLVDERQRWQIGQLYNFGDNRQWSARLGAAWTGNGHRLAPTLYFSQFDHLNRRATSSQPVAGSGELEIQRLIELDLLYNGSWSGYALDAGIEARREQIESARVQGQARSLQTVEPFAQATVPLGRFQLVPGARATFSEQWGTHLTPSLAVLYRPAETLALRASAGRGFRAPAFKELGMEFLNLGAETGYRVRGNPDLRPETSRNLSLGVEWSAPTVYLRAQAFDNRFDDFIETELVGDSSGITLFSYGNIEDGSTRGGELEGGVTYGGSRLEVGYSYLWTRDSATGLELLGRPKHSGRVALEHQLPFGVLAAATATYTGATPIERGTDGVVMRSDYLRTDLRFARALPGSLELSIGARNLFDARPDNWPGYSQRHLYVGIDWQAVRAPS